jgi:hypothetical protein
MRLQKQNPEFVTLLVQNYNTVCTEVKVVENRPFRPLLVTVTKINTYIK